MTRFRHLLLAAAIICWLAALTLVSLYFGWFTWAATPQGKFSIAGAMFLALAAWLTVVIVRDAKRRRLEREAQDEADYDEWEARLLAEDDLSMAEWRRQLRLEAEMADAAVHQVTRAEMDREDERLTTTVVPPSPTAGSWPQPQSPRMTDWAYLPADPQPMPVRYWLGDPKPMAEVDSYAGAAAWTAEAFRSGLPIAEPGVVDAPVSPAAPPVYRPRHDAEHPRPPAHAIGYNRVAARVLNEATGSFRVVRSEKVLVGAGAS
jgi:hypothetical protein